MSIFRLVLLALSAAIILFTISAIRVDGANLLPHFFGPILAGSWQGQFNVDFMCYLILSGLWMAWRGGFSGGSIALGVLAPPLGIFFFAPYLLYLTFQTGGDAKRLLLGVHAG